MYVRIYVRMYHIAGNFRSNKISNFYIQFSNEYFQKSANF